MDSIIGVLFAILLGLIAVKPYLSYQSQGARSVKAAATAGELREIAEATQSYIGENYATLIADTGPSTAATITVAMLQNTNNLSPAFSSTNPYGQTWSVQIIQPAAGNLEALVLSSGGSQIEESEAPLIAAEAGQDGGHIPYQGEDGTLTNTVAEGAYGHWSVSMAPFTNPGSGHLAGLVAFSNGNLQNDYLYRVAVPGDAALNTMETGLNMGGNSITNAQNVTATGVVSGENGLSELTGESGLSGFASTTDPTGKYSSYIFSETGQAGLNAKDANAGTLAYGEAADNEAIFEAANGTGDYAYILTGTNGQSGSGKVATDGLILDYSPSGPVEFEAESSGTTYIGNQINFGTAQTIGAACANTGAISTAANGALVSCMNGTWHSNSLFTTAGQMTVVGGVRYQNTGTTPMFISTYCQPTPASPSYLENVTLIVYAGSNAVSESDGQVAEGNSASSEFNAAPSASAMVPAGDSFAISGTAVNCTLSYSE